MSRPVIAMASMLGLRGRLRSRESPELLKWQDYVDKDDPKGLEAWEIDEDIGQGVFATKKFGVGSFLLVYKGERISCKEAERREVEYEHMKHSYLYFYTHEKRNLCIDATKSDSLGRLVNDSPLGNCEMKLKIKDGQKYLCLFATKVVNKKDELRYNYGVNGLPWRKKENMVMPLILNKKKPLDIPISKVNSLEKASSSMITENDKKSGKICGYRLRNQLTSTESEEILDWRNYVDKLEDPLGMGVRIIDDEIGRGVFATRKFGVGSFLLSYKGDKLTILEAERREAEYEHMKHSYLFFYTHERRKMCIDATYANSLGKLVNDNPQGNCEMKLKIKANQEYLCLFATKVISENEELCYNYGVKGLPWRNKEEKKKKSVKVDKVKLKCIPTNYEEEKSSNVPSNLKSRCNTYERERSFNSLKSPVCSLSQDNLDEPALTSPVSQDNLNKPPSMKSFSGLTSSIYTVSQDNLDEPYSMKSSNALSSVYSVSHDSLDEPSSMKSSSDLTVSDCQDNLYEPLSLKLIPTDYEEGNSSNVNSNMRSIHTIYEREKSFNTLKSPVCSLSQDYLDESSSLKLIPTNYKEKSFFNVPSNIKLIPTSYERQKFFSALKLPACSLSQNNLDEPSSMKSFSALTSPVYSVSQDSLYEPSSLKSIPTNYEEEKSCNVYSNMKSIHTIYERERSFNALKSPVCFLSQDNLDEPSLVKLMPSNYVGKISSSALTSSIYAVSQDNLCEPSTLKSIPTNYEEENSSNVPSNMKLINTIYERERPLTALKSPVCSLSQDNLCEPSTLKSIPTNYEEENSSYVPSNMKLINTIYERERPFNALKSPVCSLSQYNLCEPSTLKSIPTNYEEENSSNVPSNMKLINTIYERERPFNALKSPVCSLSQDNLDESSNMKSFSALTSPVYSVSQDSLYEPSSLKSIPTNYEEEKSCNVYSNMKSIHTIYERERSFNALKSPVCFLSQDNLDEPSLVKLMPSNYEGKISSSALTSSIYAVSQDNLCEPSSLKSIPTNYEEEKSSNVPSNMKLINTIYERERPLTALKSPVCSLSQDNLCEPSTLKSIPTNYEEENSSNVPSNMKLINTIYERERPFNALKSPVCSLSQDNLCEPSTLKSIPTNYEEENSSNVPSNMKLIHTIYERERPFNALKSPVCSLSQDNLDESSSMKSFSALTSSVYSVSQDNLVEPSALKSFSGLTSSVYSVSQDSLYEPSSLKSIPTKYAEENSSNVPSNMKLIHTIYERERPLTALKSPVCFLSQENLCEPSTLKSIPTNYEEENSSNVPSNMKLIHTIYERERPFNALKSSVCSLIQDNLDEPSSRKSSSALTSVYSVSQDRLRELSSVKSSSDLTFSRYSVSQDNLYEPSSLKLIPSNYEEEKSSNVPSKMKSMDTIYERENSFNALKLSCSSLSANNLNEPSSIKSSSALTSVYSVSQESLDEPSSMESSSDLTLSVYSVSQDDLNEPSRLKFIPSNYECKKPCSALTSSVYSVRQDNLDETSSKKSSSAVTLSVNSVNQGNLYESSSLKLKPTNYEKENSSNAPSNMKLNTIYEREKSFKRSLSQDNLYEPSSMKLMPTNYGSKKSSKTLKSSDNSASQDNLHEPSSLKLICTKYEEKNYSNVPSNIKVIHTIYERENSFNALKLPVCSISQDKFDEPSSMKSSRGQTSSVYSVSKDNLDKPPNMMKQIPTMSMDEMFYSDSMSGVYNVDQNDKDCPFTMKSITINNKGEKTSNVLTPSVNFIQDNLDEPSESMSLTTSSSKGDNPSNAFMLSMYSVEKASSSIVSEECSSNVEVLTNTDIVKDVEVEEKHIECDSEKEEENESDKDYMPESGLSDSSEDEICEERKAIIYTPKLIKPKMLSKTSTRKMGEPKLSASKTCTLMISEPGTSLTDTEAKLSSYKKPYRICMFCHKMKSKLSQHLKHFHKTEERVKRALQLPKKERDTEFDRMKKEGIKQQNLEEVRKDEPHFERERASDIRSDNLMMCNICDGFYSKRYIKRHSYICIKKSESSICSNGIHVSLLKHDNIVHSDDFVSEILSKFRLGIPSSKLCTTDPVLIQIGKKLWRKENKKKSKRAEVRKAVMSDMRRLASVYLEMLKCEKVLGELPCKDGNVSDIFKRNNFRHLEEAVEAYTTINFESSTDSEVKIKAGLKIGIYYLLKLVSKIMKGLYLVEANEEGDAHAADIDKFVAVLEMNHDMMFGDATYALNQSREERLRRPEAQPLESDIRKVREYTVKRIETIVAEYSLNKLNYTELRDLVICRLTLFNARRGGEPSRLHIKDWVDADEGAWLDKTLVKNLDSIDQILAKELKVSFQSGKGVKHLVPILFPKDTHVALRLLADENVRKQANIPKINKHLFPSTGGSYNQMSGWHALNNVCELLNLENRKNLTATKNRHFVSTKFSLMYVPEQDRDYIYKHLGHSEETNRHIYQNPLAIKALTVVGKRLLDMENKRDTLHSSLATNDREMETQEKEESISMDNAGKDWHNSFVSRKPSEQNLVSNEMEELLMDDAGTEDSCLVLKKPKLEKSATEELEKLQMDDAEKIWHTSLTSKKTQLEYFSSREVEELPMVDVDTLAKLNERKSQSRSHPYKKVAARNYSRWTKEEEQILRQYFKEYYERKTEKKMPGRAEIRIFLQSQPIKHELKTVATKLMNEINKENRNATVVMKEIGIIN